jgi:hypothetical protein
MANVYSLAFSVIGIVVMHSCLLVWTAIVIPHPVERARQRLESSPWLSLVVGIGCSALFAVVAGGFMLVRPQGVRWVSDGLEVLSEICYFTRFYNDGWIITNLIMWVLATPLLAAFIVGGAGFAQLFAERARTMVATNRPLLALSYGAICTSVSYFLPVVGWFVVLPLVGLISIGAGAQGLWRHRTSRADKAAPHTQARAKEPLVSRL